MGERALAGVCVCVCVCARARVGGWVGGWVAACVRGWVGGCAHLVAWTDDAPAAAFVLHNVAARMHTGVGSALRTCIPRFELEVCAPLFTTTRVTVGGQPAAECASPKDCSAAQLCWRSSAREPHRLPSNPRWVSRQRHTGGGRKRRLEPRSRARVVHGQGYQHHAEKRGHSLPEDFPR